MATLRTALPAHEIAYVQILSNTLKDIAGNDFVLPLAQLIIQYIAAIPQWRITNHVLSNSKWIHDKTMASNGNSSVLLPARPYGCLGVLCETPIWPGDRVRLMIQTAGLEAYHEIGLAHIEKAGSLENWLITLHEHSTYTTFMGANVEGRPIEVERTTNGVLLHTPTPIMIATKSPTTPEYLFVWLRLNELSPSFISISNVHSKKCS